MGLVRVFFAPGFFSAGELPTFGAGFVGACAVLRGVPSPANEELLPVTLSRFASDCLSGVFVVVSLSTSAVVGAAGVAEVSSVSSSDPGAWQRWMIQCSNLIKDPTQIDRELYTQPK